MARKSKENNINLIAEEAGVSVASVSRVLNNHPGVSERIRERVMAAVQRHHFSPDRATERRLRLCVLLGTGDITDYMSTLLTGMNLAAGEQGVELSVHPCHQVSGPLLRHCRDWRADGVAVIGGDALFGELPAVGLGGLPCMVLNGLVLGDGIGSVCCSNSALLLVLKHLQSQGQRRIAYLNSVPECRDYSERMKIYRDFMSSLGESPDQLLVSPYPIGHIEGIGRDMEAGYQQTMQLLAREHEVTAIVCANDELAVGCYKACADNGLRIPQDISVTGYDDQSFAKYLTPALTTVRQPLAFMGRRAVHALCDVIRGAEAQPPHESLMPELVIRSSVTAPR